jgi:hypothetical protein
VTPDEIIRALVKMNFKQFTVLEYSTRSIDVDQMTWLLDYAGYPSPDTVLPPVSQRATVMRFL